MGGVLHSGRPASTPMARHPISSPRLDELKVSPSASICGLMWLGLTVCWARARVSLTWTVDKRWGQARPRCPLVHRDPHAPAQRDRRILGVQPSGSVG